MSEQQSKTIESGSRRSVESELNAVEFSSDELDVMVDVATTDGRVVSQPGVFVGDDPSCRPSAPPAPSDDEEGWFGEEAGEMDVPTVDKAGPAGNGGNSEPARPGRHGLARGGIGPARPASNEPGDRRRKKRRTRRSRRSQDHGGRGGRSSPPDPGSGPSSPRGMSRKRRGPPDRRCPHPPVAGGSGPGGGRGGPAPNPAMNPVGSQRNGKEPPKFLSKYALTPSQKLSLERRMGNAVKVEPGKLFTDSPVYKTIIDFNLANLLPKARAAGDAGFLRGLVPRGDKIFYGAVNCESLSDVLFESAEYYAPAYAQGGGAPNYLDLAGMKVTIIVPSQLPVACEDEVAFVRPIPARLAGEQSIEDLSVQRVAGCIYRDTGDWMFLYTHEYISVGVSVAQPAARLATFPQLYGHKTLTAPATYQIFWDMQPASLGVPVAYVVTLELRAPVAGKPVMSCRFKKSEYEEAGVAVEMRMNGCVTEVRDDEFGVISLPASLVDEVTISAQESLDSKAWRSVHSTARNHTRKIARTFPHLAGYMPRVHLAAYRVGIVRAVENAQILRPLQDMRTSIEKANELYQYPDLHLPWWEIALFILSVLLLIYSFVVCVFHFTIEIPGIWVTLGALPCALLFGRGLVQARSLYRALMRPGMELGLAVMAVAALSIATLPGVFAWDGTGPLVAVAMSPLIPVIFVISVVFLVLFRAVRRFKNTDAGEAWLHRIEQERELLRFEGPLPRRSVAPLESTYDIRQLKLNPAAIIRFAEETRFPTTNDVGTGSGLEFIFVFCDAVPICYSRSDHNCYVSCLSRACISMPGPTRPLRELVELASRCKYPPLTLGEIPDGEYRHNGEWVEGHPWLTMETYIQKFPSGQRKRLQQWARKIKNGDYRRGQLAYKGFVKREKLVVLKEGGFEPYRPRMIQGLSDLAKLMLGPFFDQVTFVMKCVHHLQSSIWYTCGATTYDYAEWFDYHHQRLGEDVMFFYSDFSKYDVTQCPELIALENEGYVDQGILGAVPDDPDFVREILAAMAQSKVYYRDNFWSVPGTRKSGDLNTSSGNSASTARFLDSFMVKHGITAQEFAVAVLGDDNFGMMSRRAFALAFGSEKKFLRAFDEHAAEWGFRVDPAGITPDVLSAEYVSCRFYPAWDPVTERVVHAIGKKPGRTLAKIGVLLEHKDRRFCDSVALMKGVLLSILDTSAHVPFLGPVVMFLLEYLSEVEEIMPTHPGIEGHSRYEVHSETYAHFYELYGLTRDDEQTFVAAVTGQISKYGLPCCLDVPFMQVMLAIDL